VQLAAHAEEAEHPLCLVCSRSLALTERQSCERCLTSSRELLAGISLMYAELPEHVGHVRGARYDADAPAAADGRPLPGGVVLVLLGKGSAGYDDDGTTVKPGDPSSVAFDLAFWANIWAQARGEGPAVDDQVSAKRQVRDAVAYLDTMTRWAGQQHSGFALYVEDVRLLHSRLERATGRGERAERAEAECFTCGADALVRKLTDRGLEDRWTCARCGAVYDWQRYLLACRARVEDGRQTLRLVGWGTVRQVAAAVGAPLATVRKWAQRGVVATCCVVESQEQLVWYPDADERAQRNRRGQDRRTG
jgi:transposase-like protein